MTVAKTRRPAKKAAAPTEPELAPVEGHEPEPAPELALDEFGRPSGVAGLPEPTPEQLAAAGYKTAE